MSKIGRWKEILDRMAARIGQKIAQLYADRFKSQKRRDIEELIREVSHDS